MQMRVLPRGTGALARSASATAGEEWEAIACCWSLARPPLVFTHLSSSRKRGGHPADTTPETEFYPCEECCFTIIKPLTSVKRTTRRDHRRGKQPLTSLQCIWLQIATSGPAVAAAARCRGTTGVGSLTVALTQSSVYVRCGVDPCRRCKPGLCRADSPDYNAWWQAC